MCVIGFYWTKRVENRREVSNRKEKMPFVVVKDFDLMDGGELMTPPMCSVKLVEDKSILSMIKGDME